MVAKLLDTSMIFLMLFALLSIVGILMYSVIQNKLIVNFTTTTILLALISFFLSIIFSIINIWI